MFRPKRKASDFNAEVEAHLELEAERLNEQGLSKEEARMAARRAFGNLTQAQERFYESGRWVWWDHLMQDVRYGLRMLRMNPGFTAVVTVTIALGVGINVGIFSVLNGFTLRLLPVRHAEQLVSVAQIFHGKTIRDTHGETSMFSLSEYREYRDQSRVFSGLLAYEPFVEATLAGPSMRQVLGTTTSCNYFDVLNERPAQGRGFVDSDCTTSGANAEVVISDALWRGAFAGDRGLVGKTITLNRTSYIVIGITRPGFVGTEPVSSDFWAPLTMQPALEGGQDRLREDNQSWLALLGRMRPGVTMEQVQANLGLIAGRIDQLHPGRRTSLAIHVATFLGRPEEREILIPVALIIFVACGLVLLLACANVANLLLARAFVRSKEIALRLSIGASRGRLVRQLLTESLLLSLMGGALGSLIAFWSFPVILRALVSHLPIQMPPLTVNLAPDGRVLAFALGLTLLTGIAFGLIPALHSSRPDLNTALKEDSANSGLGKRSGRFLRNALVGAQIAASMVLLLAAGLLLRGLYYAQTVDPGFETKDVASIFFNLKLQGYDDDRAGLFMQRLRANLERTPGVSDIAQAECAPLSHDYSVDRFTVPGRPNKVFIEYNHVSPEYFSVVGVPIVRGHNFNAEEGRDEAPVVIVTESTARHIWPKEDPIGKTLREDGGREFSVIGVARDAQISHLGEISKAYLFYPAGAKDNARAYVMVRFGGEFTTVAKAIRDTARSIDPGVPTSVIKLEDNLETWRKPSRIVAALSGTLGGLALVLASIGVYGMVSYSVSRRVREIGIRMALGADGAQVRNLVLRQAMRPVLMGGLAGVAGCAAVSSVFSSLLFGLSPHDPWAFVAVPLFLMVMALVASYIPARGAMRVEPIVALRHE